MMRHHNQLNSSMVGAIVFLTLSSSAFTATPVYADTPIGNVDAMLGSYVWGWAYDPADQSADVRVDIYLDGPVGTGTFLLSTAANVERTDINTALGITGNHGYIAPLPCELFDGVSHSLYVYAADSSGNSGGLTQSPYVFPTALYQIERVAMRDSVELATEVYLPDSSVGPGPWPVMMIRTPYGKGGQAGIAPGLNSLGIAVIMQDMRGRCASGGEFMAFLSDGNGDLKDAVDTFSWIVNQQWSNGIITTDGGSANGIIQYIGASAAPPGLRAMSVYVGTPNFYQDALFPGGVFRQSLAEGWLDTGLGESQMLAEVQAHPLLDVFWRPVQTSESFMNVDIPVRHVGGWFDIFAQGTLDAFVGYQTLGGVNARGKHKLVMGPWTHSFAQTIAGEFTFPDNAADTPTKLYDDWANWHLHYLGISPNQALIDAQSAVTYYVMGAVDEAGAPGNEWRTNDSWPVEAAALRYYLHSDGGLRESCSESSTSSTEYIYDPLDPTPTLGGPNLVLDAGPYDHSLIEARPDVVVFSSEVLSEPTEITGRIHARLFAQIDQPDADLMVTLSDVYPDGRSMLILDGAARIMARDSLTELKPVMAGEVVEVEIDLSSTSLIFNAGHRIRISISSANSERFLASANDGLNYGELRDSRPVTISLIHRPGQASYVEFPMPARLQDQTVLCPATPDDSDEDSLPAPEQPVESCGNCSAVGSVPTMAWLILLLFWRRVRRKVLGKI